jgi:hypothetical protein
MELKAAGKLVLKSALVENRLTPRSMGRPAARAGDPTAHGVPLGPGPKSADVLIVRTAPLPA